MAFDSNDVGERLAQQGLLLTILSVFGFGVLVSLTPCVYPMIPITLGIIGARSAGQKALIGFLRSVIFVLGIAVVYSALGYFAARTGRFFGFLLQNKWVIGAIAAFFIAMGLSMMDFFTIQMPTGIAGKLQTGANRGGFAGAFLLGMVTAVVASPCGSPVLASILAISAKSGKEFVGFVLLFSHALGIGLLFLVLGAFPAFIKAIPKSGAWMDDIKKFLGLVLIGVACYYLRLVIPGTVFWPVIVILSLGAALVVAVKAQSKTSPAQLFAWRIAGAGLALFAVYAAFMEIPPALTRATKGEMSPTELAQLAKQELRGLANPQAATDIQTAEASGPPSPASSAAGLPMPPRLQAKSNPSAATAATDVWLDDEASGLAEAKSTGRPVIIDFGAEWCPACKELERKTFPEARVREALGNYVKIRIDCTEESDKTQELQAKYGARSLPTVAFIDKNGKLQKDLTLYTFEPPEKFLERVKKVLQ